MSQEQVVVSGPLWGKSAGALQEALYLSERTVFHNGALQVTHW